MVILLYILAIAAVAVAPYVVSLFGYRVLRNQNMSVTASLVILWPCALLASFLILQASFEVMREAWFFWMFFGLPIQAGGLIGILLLPVHERASKGELPEAGAKRWLSKWFLNRWSFKERLLLFGIGLVVIITFELLRRR